jgi:hypothetical protein
LRTYFTESTAQPSPPLNRGRPEPFVRLIFGEKVAAVLNSLGEAKTTRRRAATKLPGLFDTFSGSTWIGIFLEQLEGVRTWNM